MNVLSRLLESIIDMPGEFADVVTAGSVDHLIITSILITMGALLVIVSSAVFGILTLGAVIDLVTPGSTGASHPEGR